MIKDRKPEPKRVTPKPNGSHLTPILKDVKARQNTAGRTVGTDTFGKFDDPQGVPAGIAEPTRNMKPKSTGSQKIPQARWVTSKVDRTSKPSRITEKHVAKRVI